jgi:hypothetical protein
LTIRAKNKNYCEKFYKSKAIHFNILQKLRFTALGFVPPVFLSPAQLFFLQPPNTDLLTTFVVSMRKDEA